MDMPDDTAPGPYSPLDSQSLALLFDASAAMLANRDPLALIEQLYERLARLLGVEIYAHFTVAPEGGYLALAASGGFTPEQQDSLHRLEYGQAVCGTVAQTRERMVVNDVQASASPMTDVIRSLGITAYVCHPLIVDDELFGTLSFGTRKHAQFDEGAVELIRAVSDHVSVALARSRAERLLLETDRRKDEFLAVLAHELRNPLAAIRSGIDVVQAAPAVPPIVAKAGAAMERQARQLVALVEDLLEISRIREGRLELRTRRVALAEIVDNAVAQAGLQLDKGEHSLLIEMPDEPIVLDADAVRLSQVLANLLDNAAKYTPQGGRIKLRAEHRGDELELAVTDDGHGIPADKLDEIFEPFAQLEPAAAGVGGLGLGLPLVKSLVQLHGGSVEVNSPGRGHGSEFVVRLPLRTNSGVVG